MARNHKLVCRNPGCNKTYDFYGTPYEAQRRSYCSKQCAAHMWRRRNLPPKMLKRIERLEAGLKAERQETEDHGK